MVKIYDRNQLEADAVLFKGYVDEHRIDDALTVAGKYLADSDQFFYGIHVRVIGALYVGLRQARRNKMARALAALTDFSTDALDRYYGLNPILDDLYNESP